MVLDSNVDPTRVWYGANLDQDRAFQRNIKIWFRWLAQYNARVSPGQQRAGRRTALVPHSGTSWRSTPDHGIGPDEWTDVFLDAEYYQSTWLNEARLFAGLRPHGTITRRSRSAYADAHDDERVRGLQRGAVHRHAVADVVADLVA